MCRKLIKPIIGVFLILNLLSCQNSTNRPVENKAEIVTDSDTLKEGDIIFQVSTSGQGKAIQLATQSAYTHCGILFKEGKNWMVWEAVQPVKKTVFDEWTNRGINGHYVIKRLKKSEEILTQATLKRMKTEGEKMIGKNYDLTFEWDDSRIYCSELVYKLYQRGAGISVGKVAKMKTFDLSHPLVKDIIAQRFGTKIPVNETVISPAAIFKSDLLLKVIEVGQP